MRVQIDFGALFLVAFGLAVLVAALGMGGKAGTIVAVVCVGFIVWVLARSFIAERPDSD